MLVPLQISLHLSCRSCPDQSLGMATRGCSAHSSCTRANQPTLVSSIAHAGFEGDDDPLTGLGNREEARGHADTATPQLQCGFSVGSKYFSDSRVSLEYRALRCFELVKVDGVSLPNALLFPYRLAQSVEGARLQAVEMRKQRNWRVSASHA